MTAAGLVFASSANRGCCSSPATMGVISPSGQEVGPFLPIEQAALAHVVTDRRETEVFAWYTLAGSMATALGALAGGPDHALRSRRLDHRSTAIARSSCCYAALGVVLALSFCGSRRADRGGDRLRPAAPASIVHRPLRTPPVARRVMKLSALFALDSFGGGFVVQSFTAYWFYLRFGIDPATLGAIFFWANMFAGLSALLASRLAARIGLVRTMVVTHLPSNVLLILIPLMPTLPLAVAGAARAVQHQPDGRADQAVLRHGRGRALTSAPRLPASPGWRGPSGAAISPLFVGLMFARPSLINLPFFIAGLLKIAYDLLLFRAFRSLKPPEEE